MKDGDSVRILILKELEYFRFKVSESGKFDTVKVVKALKKAIGNDRTIIHDYIYKIVNPKEFPAIRLNYFKEVARLHDGHSFGELALL